MGTTNRDGVSASTKTAKLEELKTATQKSIEEKKKFDYKVPSVFWEIEDEYYKNYLKNTVKERVNFTEITSRKRSDKGKKKIVRYDVMPIHNYNTILAMAFAKAEKLYSELRKKIRRKYAKTEKEKKKKTEAKSDQVQTPQKQETQRSGTTEPKIDITHQEDSEKELELSKLSPLEYTALSERIFSGKNSGIETSLKQLDFSSSKNGAEREYQWYRALKGLRNFHAHIFHEPGPVSFKNLYGELYKGNKLSQKQWKEARKFFDERFKEAKNQTLKTLTKSSERGGTTKEKKDLKEVTETINGYEFERNGYVTSEALLFIACMFLRRSDADFFIKKWTGIKQTQGVKKSTQNFFKHFTIKDSKSIQPQNRDMFRYKQIISLLSTMPQLTTKSLQPFYEVIRKHNDSCKQKAKQAEIKKDNTAKKRHISYIIPTRTSTNYTKWYLTFLNDNNLLEGFEVAYYKTATERAEYLEERGMANMKEFKANIKSAKGTDKKELAEIYKKAKKNFLFKKPSKDNENFCIKTSNAIFKYTIETPTDSEVTIQVSVSTDFLMKWVFSHLVKKDGVKVRDRLLAFINARYAKSRKMDFDNNLFDLPPKKIFPSSLTKTVEEPENVDAEKIIRIIDNKLEVLQQFKNINDTQTAQWKYASKRKIDIIFEYVHRVYLDTAYNEGKTASFIQQKALDSKQYLKAFEYLRFYGRYYETPEFGAFFFDRKRTYFNSIVGILKKSDTLENVFDTIIGLYLTYLKDVRSKLEKGEADVLRYALIFKARRKSLEENKSLHADLSAVNHCIPHELIKLNTFDDYTEWQEKMKGKEWVSDFSFMRYILEKSGGFSNTDYLMKQIMPIVLKKDLLPKENGKIKGIESLFNSLMKNKTNELMLWEMGKWYWKRAIGKDFSNNNFPVTLNRNEDKEIAVPYKKTNPYYEIFKKELELKLQRKQGGGRIYKVKIKPKKFDDELQYYEQQLILDYIEGYEDDKKVKDKNTVRKFVDLNKNIKNELTKYLDDVYLLMTVEKYIVDKNFDTYASSISAEAATKDSTDFPDYYLPFKGELMNKMYNSLPNNKRFTAEDLNIYRNNILHQELQPKGKFTSAEGFHHEIKKSLIAFCEEKELLKPVHE